MPIARSCRPPSAQMEQSVLAHPLTDAPIKKLTIAGRDVSEYTIYTENEEKILASAADLAAMIEEMNVGDTITLKVVRIKQDYTYDEFTFTGKLVEDKADAVPQEEETTTSNSFEDFFGSYFGDGSGNGSGDSFDDFFGRNP